MTEQQNVYAAAAAAKSLQSCPILCDPRDSSPPGFPVPGILQARTLDWVAISFSKMYMHVHVNICVTERDASFHYKFWVNV